jgi:multidrug resistance protein, MATE family
VNTESQQGELEWRHRPFPELVRLAWPIVTSLLSYSAMTLVDALFVGRLGANAIAATGLGATATFGVLCFGLGLFSGAKVKISEIVGGGDRSALPQLLGALLRIALVLGLLSAVVGWLVARLLPQVSADAESGHLALQYCQLRSLGMPLALLVCAVAQYRQALGDSRTAMRAAIFANLVHIPLNAFLIFGCGWGVRGAASASVVCTGIEALALCLAQSNCLAAWRAADLRQSVGLVIYGLPTAVERWLDSLAFVSLVALLAHMGAVQLAAHQITLQILHFCFLPMIALGDAVCVLVAQARGAGETSVASRVVRYALGVGFAFGGLCALVLVVFGASLVSAFTTDVVVQHAAVRVLWIAAGLQWVNSAFTVFKGALRGFGALRYVAVVSVVCAWLFTPGLTWYFGYHLGWGAAGGWFGLSVEIAAGTLCLAYRARKFDPGLGPRGFVAQLFAPREPAETLAAVSGRRL